MAAPIVNTVAGVVKLKGLPETVKITSWKDLIEKLSDLLLVEVPVGSGSVVVSIGQPSAENVNKLWIRLNTSGNYTGSYVFSEGAWQLAYVEPPQSIRWFYGDSDKVPPLWTVIRAGDSEVPATVVSQLMSQYISLGPDRYSYYAARFVGY